MERDQQAACWLHDAQHKETPPSAEPNVAPAWQQRGRTIRRDRHRLHHSVAAHVSQPNGRLEENDVLALQCPGGHTMNSGINQGGA
jgi:hypothetical protein